MNSLTRWVLTHKRAVVLSWVALTAAGGVAVTSIGGALSQRFSISGPGVRASEKIERELGTGGQVPPLVLVVTLPPGSNVDQPDVRTELGRAFARVAAVVPHARVASLLSTGDRALVSADGRTTLALIFPVADQSNPNATPPSLSAARAAARSVSVAGEPVLLSGFAALVNAGTASKGPGVIVEALLGAGGALLVLAFVFASFVAIIPLFTALTAIMTTFLVIRGLAAVTTVSVIVEFLIALVGLGIAIDYALLVIVRWREERARGASNEDAVARAMRTAGRAVMFSGTTVAIGLLALIVLPVPFLRSVGYGGMLIPLISVAVALTLLPVILATVGPSLDRPRIRHEERASRGWTSWGRLVVRRRFPAAAAGIAVLVALVIAATSIHPGAPTADALANAGDAHSGLVALERSGIGAGVLVPFEALTNAENAPEIAHRLASVSGVRGAIAPTGSAWRRAGNAVIDVIPSADGSTAAGRATLDRVRAAAKQASLLVQIGGPDAANADFISAVYGTFPEMIALIALITFLLLARAFRSLLLPLKAVVLNVVSVGAAWGVMTLVWQDGHGSHLIWGIPATGSITSWVPLMTFAFLFGLSMDYEVFILARTREEYDATGSTRQAAVGGIARTGRLVTCAALILFLSFVALSTGPDTDIKILATGLGAGILLDATVVRALLVPALVSLFGNWNWWMPDLPARLLRVAPSPIAAKDSTAATEPG